MSSGNRKKSPSVHSDPPQPVTKEYIVNLRWLSYWNDVEKSDIALEMDETVYILGKLTFDYLPTHEVYGEAIHDSSFAAWDKMSAEEKTKEVIETKRRLCAEMPDDLKSQFNWNDRNKFNKWKTQISNYDTKMTMQAAAAVSYVCVTQSSIKIHTRK